MPVRLKKLCLDKDFPIFQNIMNNSNKLEITSEYYNDGCLVDQSSHMINNSKYCIFYVGETRDWSYRSMQYAHDNKRNILNIFNLVN